MKPLDFFQLFCRFVVGMCALILISTFSVASASASLSLNASPDSDRDLVELQLARTAADLDRIQERLNLDQTLDTDCRAELDQKVLPKSCFRALRQRGFDEPGWLKAECLARAKVSKSRVELQSGLELLPKTCQSAALQRLADLHYLDASERPSEIWTLEQNVKRTTGNE